MKNLQKLNTSKQPNQTEPSTYEGGSKRKRTLNRYYAMNYFQPSCLTAHCVYRMPVYHAHRAPRVPRISDGLVGAAVEEVVGVHGAHDVTRRCAPGDGGGELRVLTGVGGVRVLFGNRESARGGGGGPLGAGG